jgi:ABC-type cobalamin/Fe3+-siderophores transport system ATPase subunit
MAMTNMTGKLFPHGSRWLRADFHLHTRADKEFSYTDGENYYLSNYIDALNLSEIEIGIITNHNKFDLVEFKALRKTASKKGIFLLPGIELSVNDGANGIHSLIIFHEEWIANGQDYINQFLNIAFTGKTPDQYENENGRSSLGLIDTIKKLESYHKAYFIVFAHVEDRSGLWHELDGGRLKELGKDKFFRKSALALQKVRTHDVQDRKCRVKVQGWLQDAYPAEVEGSDPKAVDQIGQGQACFLKVGDFTFEAVRYALLDHDNRIEAKPQHPKHSHIESVSFDGGVLNGKTIQLSAELNTLIGIRGSGKSSILEAIRYALNVPFGEKTLDIEYKTRLVDHVLGSGGMVTVHAIDQRGQRYEIRRINGETADVYIDNILQPGISIRETILHKPIYFGQKDLSATGEGFEKDLVEKLVGEKLSGVRLRIEEQRQKVVEIVGQLKKLADMEEKKQEYEDQRKDAEFKLTFYKKHGVEKKLQKQVDFDNDSRKITQVTTFVKSYLEELDTFIGQYEDDLKNERVYTSKQNKTFFDDFFAVYDNLVNTFKSVKTTYTEGKQTFSELRKKADTFEKLKSGLKDEFAEIERKLSEQLKASGVQAIRPDKFRMLRKNVEQSKQMLKVLDQQETARKSLNQDLLRELAALNDLWREEYKAIQEELNKVNRSHSALEIRSEFKGDKIAFKTFIKDIFKGSRIRETTFSELTDKFSDFGAIYKDFGRARDVVAASAPVFEQYFSDNQSALLTWQVPNRFTIEYRGKELKHHSLGQRASALILFVLSQQENDVVIIDQPEDDLDNQTIYEDVIKLIHSLKPQTQFVFATHNANFPVLGDAEQIIACTYSDDIVHATSGSIDCPRLQREIVNIMEGGKEAFEQRRRRYEVWKPLNS